MNTIESDGWFSWRILSRACTICTSSLSHNLPSWLTSNTLKQTAQRKNRLQIHSLIFITVLLSLKYNIYSAGILENSSYICIHLQKQWCEKARKILVVFIQYFHFTSFGTWKMMFFSRKLQPNKYMHIDAMLCY